jgi:hypothetical protein
VAEPPLHEIQGFFGAELSGLKIQLRAVWSGALTRVDRSATGKIDPSTLAVSRFV